MAKRNRPYLAGRIRKTGETKKVLPCLKCDTPMLTFPRLRLCDNCSLRNERLYDFSEAMAFAIPDTTRKAGAV